MAKAMMVRVYNGVQNANGSCDFTGEVCVTTTPGDSTLVTLEITRPSWSEEPEQRKNAWRTAIINKAFEDFEVVVDEVMFEDFSV